VNGYDHYGQMIVTANTQDELDRMSLEWESHGWVFKGQLYLGWHNDKFIYCQWAERESVPMEVENGA